ncbi:HAD family hydrolase [Streptococcus sp. H49]|uniref:HAD family hydrolase n=1 Tax=Streptococcus huangxiaojuni TaxID=3237239 RepID=UPI0034A4FDBB
MIKAVIFDMDGVLFDTESFYFKRRKKFLAEKGISIDHLEARDFVGGRLDQIWNRILGDLSSDYDTKNLERQYILYKEEHRAPYEQLIFPDTKQVIEKLKQSGIRLALASNSEYGDIFFALDSVGLKNSFDPILSGSDFTESKPDPAIYNKACDLLGFDKKEIVVVEDSLKGIAAGKAAGLRVFAIRDHLFDLDQSQADFLVDCLSQVQKYIAEENEGR